MGRNHKQGGKIHLASKASARAKNPDMTALVVLVSHEAAAKPVTRKKVKISRDRNAAPKEDFHS